VEKAGGDHPEGQAAALGGQGVDVSLELGFFLVCQRVSEKLAQGFE
jgi:hypothetical protein